MTLVVMYELLRILVEAGGVFVNIRTQLQCVHEKNLFACCSTRMHVKMLANICNILYIKCNVTYKLLCSGEISEKSGEDEEEEDANVLHLPTPEGGPLIVAALDNSRTEV